MQELFAPDGPWATPWLPRVLPEVVRLVERHASSTIFTRFIPPPTPRQARGAWRRYYERWSDVTTERLDPRMLALVSPLGAFVPPAEILDKSGYSAFSSPRLLDSFARREANALVITGSETDVCVLATILAAVDWGFRVVIAVDAVCSSSDEGHDALIAQFERRFSEQIETATVDDILEGWRDGG